MGLGARLARLEERAPRLLRCAWCRYALVPVRATKGGRVPAPDEFTLQTCPFCGATFRQVRGSYTPRQHESLLLWHNKVGGETYRDERAYAALQWWTYHAERERVLRGQDGPKPRPYGRPEKAKKLPRAAEERAELKRRAYAFLRKQREREERLYGPRSFPLVARLEELEKAIHVSTLDGYEHRTPDEIKALKLAALARCQEACELVLWGEVEEATRAEVEAREAEAASLKEQRQAEKCEREERQKREAAEREERYRLEREQRGRGRLERETGRGPAQGQAASDYPARSSIFWKKPEEPEPAGDARERLKALKRQVGEEEVAPFIPDPWEPGRNKVKPKLPPDDGTDPNYAIKKVIYEHTGMWPRTGE